MEVKHSFRRDALGVVRRNRTPSRKAISAISTLAINRRYTLTYRIGLKF